MTKRFYSPTTRGFYSDDIHKTPAERPEDCFEIEEQQLRNLLDAQEAGQLISWDAETKEFKTSPPLITMMSIRMSRNVKLRNSDWTQMLDVPEATRSKWAAYRQELRDLPQQFEGRPSEVVWPDAPQ